MGKHGITVNIYAPGKLWTAIEESRSQDVIFRINQYTNESVVLSYDCDELITILFQAKESLQARSGRFFVSSYSFYMKIWQIIKGI